ncbi:MAG: SpoIID/LytB domain-containing protein [bacterium]
MEDSTRGRAGRNRKWRVGSALAALALGGLAGPAGAELSRRDRLAVLYSNQVIFDRAGEPLVSVRITEGQSRVEVESAGGVTLLPGADDGSRVRARDGARWTLTLADAHPGEARHWIAAERIGAQDPAAMAAARARWAADGREVATFEAGALLGISGETLDTRVVTIGIEPKATEAEARAAAAALGLADAEVVAEPRTRAGGWIVAREAKSGVEIRARDLLWFSPDPGATLTIPDLEWGHGTPKRGHARRTYAGDLYVAVGNDGRLAVVNLLSAERLLEGVVPSEIYPSAPPAALQAQAVAARGQLLAKVGTRHRSDPYLLCAETHCQKYTGETRTNPATSAAVAATRGQLLFDAAGLVDTVYSAACGGHTEAADAMWGGAPRASLPGLTDTASPDVAPVEDVDAFLAHPDPAAVCAWKGDHFRWTRTLTGAQLSAAVGTRAAIGPVHTVLPTRRGRSGRALAVRYVGRDGDVEVAGSYVNRTLLGGLKSGLWQVRREGGAPDGEPARWIFSGAGFGHGVGLCQHGAIGMARQGHAVEAILRHYYPGSALRRAW